MKIKYYAVYDYNNHEIKNFLSLESAKNFVEEKAKLLNDFRLALRGSPYCDYTMIAQPMWVKLENKNNYVFRAQCIDKKGKVHQLGATNHIKVVNLNIEEG